MPSPKNLFGCRGTVHLSCPKIAQYVWFVVVEKNEFRRIWRGKNLGEQLRYLQKPL